MLLFGAKVETTVACGRNEGPKKLLDLYRCVVMPFLATEHLCLTAIAQHVESNVMGWYLPAANVLVLDENVRGMRCACHGPGTTIRGVR